MATKWRYIDAVRKDEIINEALSGHMTTAHSRPQTPMADNARDTTRDEQLSPRDEPMSPRDAVAKKYERGACASSPANTSSAAKQTIKRTKRSSGIACCRRQEGKLQVLMVQKRYTYAYSRFVNGNYVAWDRQGIMRLFGEMTMEEKSIIGSMDFVKMWQRVWNDKARSGSFHSSRSKFENNWGRDGGRRLKDMLNRSGWGKLVWEVPKGRRLPEEAGVECAVREFREETGVDKSQYLLYPQVTRTIQHVSGDTRYISTYYLAMCDKVLPRIDYSRGQDEVADITWMSIEDIRSHDCTGRTERVIKPLFNYIRNNL
jgi:8-oxo-dGTP pyrophosphatase MutT (NUDIX family)